MAFLQHHSNQARNTASHRAQSLGLLRRLAAGRCPKAGLAWLACLLASALPLSAAEEVALSEHQVKAAQILKFVHFSEWPAGSFAQTNSPYVIGIAGRDPFGKDLDRIFENKSVKGRPFVIKRITDEQELRNCHLVFVSSSERRRLKDLLDKLKGAAVLTVGESPEFLDQSGVINFLLKDSSVRFEINLAAAQAAKVKLDANLLKVAVAVRGKYD